MSEMSKIIEQINIAEEMGDIPKSFRFYKKAAELGNVIAMAIVARLYELGIHDVEQDIHKALKWYVEAANADEPHAKQRLETLFEEGR